MQAGKRQQRRIFPPERQFGLSVGQKRTLVQIHKSRVIVKA